MKPQITSLTLLLLLALVMPSSLMRRALAQATQPEAKRGIAFNTDHRHCEPVEVKAFYLDGRQPGFLLTGVTIDNRSAKTVTAIKVGWKVYDFREGFEVATARCAAPPSTAQVFLTGSTPLIPLAEPLGPKETCNLGTKSMRLLPSATKTIFVEQPFLKVEDVSALTLDGTLKTLTGQYTLVLFVAEATYDDGTTWTAESN